MNTRKFGLLYQGELLRWTIGYSSITPEYHLFSNDSFNERDKECYGVFLVDTVEEAKRIRDNPCTKEKSSKDCPSHKYDPTKIDIVMVESSEKITPFLSRI